MRLDKFLSNSGCGTRSEVKKEIKKGNVSVNHIVVKREDYRIDETKDYIQYIGEAVQFNIGFRYLLMNKPVGVVCTNTKEEGKTVYELLPEEFRKDYFTVGRLDKYTEGLLLITNDGEFSHRVLSPKNHVHKTYLVECEKAVTDEDVKRLETGVDLGDDEKSLPASVKRADAPNRIFLTISEGKYHQVKRMLKATCNKVVYLKRTGFGPLTLPEDLLPGEWMELDSSIILKF